MAVLTSAERELFTRIEDDLFAGELPRMTPHERTLALSLAEKQYVGVLVEDEGDYLYVKKHLRTITREGAFLALPTPYVGDHTLTAFTLAEAQGMVADWGGMWLGAQPDGTWQAIY